MNKGAGLSEPEEERLAPRDGEGLSVVIPEQVRDTRNGTFLNTQRSTMFLSSARIPFKLISNVPLHSLLNLD